MIYLNEERIQQASFPDKTSSIRINPDEFIFDDTIKILWLYDGDVECMILWNLVHHIREFVGPCTPIDLTMPYIPNARMDRVKNGDEVFTLKWFSEFINSLNFRRVYVIDPHSNVSMALINGIVDMGPERCIAYAKEKLNDNKKNVLLCYPDAGAAKRYSSMFPQTDHVVCEKDRDWRTGKINGVILSHPELVKDRNILIIDDICSKGGTFTHTARKLIDAGAKEIYLYVTHCEDNIFNGTVLTDGLISGVFTTNSIFRGNHENICVMDIMHFYDC